MAKSTLSSLVPNERANAEIIFVALLTLVIGTVGVVGINTAIDITQTTEDKIDKPEFQVASSTNGEISYSNGPLISPKNTDKLIAQSETGNETILFDSSEQGEISHGDTYSLDPQSNPNFEYGTTVEIIWEKPNGDSEIVQEIYIEDESTRGTTLTSEGEIILDGNMSNEDTNETTIQLE